MDQLMTDSTAPLTDKLSQPARRALASVDIEGREHLSTWTERKIGDLHGMGPKGIQVIRVAMEEHHLRFESEF